MALFLWSDEMFFSSFKLIEPNWDGATFRSASLSEWNVNQRNHGAHQKIFWTCSPHIRSLKRCSNHNQTVGYKCVQNYMRFGCNTRNLVNNTLFRMPCFLMVVSFNSFREDDKIVLKSTYVVIKMHQTRKPASTFLLNDPHMSHSRRDAWRCKYTRCWETGFGSGRICLCWRHVFGFQVVLPLKANTNRPDPALVSHRFLATTRCVVPACVQKMCSKWLQTHAAFRNMCRLCLEAVRGTIRCSLTSVDRGHRATEVRGWPGSRLRSNPVETTGTADGSSDIRSVFFHLGTQILDRWNTGDDAPMNIY